MKTIKIIAIAFLIAATTQFLPAKTAQSSFFTSTTVNEEVTAQEVVEYLHQTGHTLLCNPVTRNGGITWAAITTIKNDGHTYLTTVYVEGGYITGYDDEILD